jgi:pimeloyl-ACP methyl ester carboxylesterase
MNSITSRDGTRISFERTGEGPPLVLVVGAFNDRHKGAPLAAALGSHFSVYCYDRRGRGDSGDAADHAVEREVEDLQALIGAAGGSAAVFGYSSGAMLALKAAAAGLPITQLALYELPPAQAPEHARELAALVAAGRRGDAVEYFQLRIVGIPEHVVHELRGAPFRPALEAMAHTLVYDVTILGAGAVSSEQLANIRQPCLAIAGGASPPVMREVSAALARSLPNGRSLILENATHEIEPAVLAPVLEHFFNL